jgi:hypothetical protein
MKNNLKNKYTFTFLFILENRYFKIWKNFGNSTNNNNNNVNKAEKILFSDYKSIENNIFTFNICSC